jgi:hypothetical protein
VPQKNSHRKVTGTRNHLHITLPLREASLADILKGDTVLIDVVPDTNDLFKKEIRIKKLVKLDEE